ncbi:MAG: FixH family protein [Pseudomonadota bacterium]|nr:FixH family protein [Pseudomonadota bacterium]
MTLSPPKSSAQRQNKPWYRHPHLWLVILLPLLSIVVSLSFVTTAFKNQVDVVRDDWYMDGKALQQDMSRDTTAAEANLIAQFQLSPTGQIDLTLSANQGTAIPPQLSLNFYHPIRAEKDHQIALQRREDGHYQGQLDAELLKPSNYHVELDGHLWRLSGRIDLPTTEFKLSPNANLLAAITQEVNQTAD